MSGERNTILVTGGAGYIGSHTIIEILENTSWGVISADNYSNSSAASFKRIRDITGKEVKNYEIDLCDKALVNKLFKENADIKGIIHFAAFKSVPDSVLNPLPYYHNNIESMVNLLQAVKDFNIPYFIFSSSCSVYGNIAKLPVNEKTPMGQAASPYGHTKQIGEQMLRDLTVKYKDAHTIALRYFNPVGAHSSGLIGEVPTQKPNNLVPMITQTAIGKQKEMIVYGTDYTTRDGTCIRDYVHVCDIARAHIDALNYLLNNPKADHFNVFNLGTGNGVTVMEMIHAFEKVSGRKLNYKVGPRREGDIEAIYSDSMLVQSVLHWRPKYSLDDMMRTAWQWEENCQRNS
jgi:UDP-glucose 4-epimerase